MVQESVFCNGGFIWAFVAIAQIKSKQMIAVRFIGDLFLKNG
jgi:hypothetical protein